MIWKRDPLLPQRLQWCMGGECGGAWEVGVVVHGGGGGDVVVYGRWVWWCMGCGWGGEWEMGVVVHGWLDFGACMDECMYG